MRAWTDSPRPQRGWTILRIPTAAHRHTTHPTYLLIGPRGVLVAQHQVWTVADTVTTSLHSGLLLIGGRPAIRRTASVRATAEVVDEALAHHLPGEHLVRAVIAVEGKTLDESRVVAGVSLVPVIDLARLLRRSDVVLTEPEIVTVADTARRLFTARKPHGEALAAGLAPADLYGPATMYAATLAQAARSAPLVSAPLDRARGPIVLRLSGVTKRYRRREVLHGVDLTVRAGEVAAVVGANGSGKSTLLDICAGVTRPSGGVVERTARVGYAPQQHGVAPYLTADEHFRLFGAVHGMSARRAVATGTYLCRALGWRPRPGIVAGQLSGGTQQKLNVVLSELNRPDLILLDEPYQGFDQESYLDLWTQVFAWRDAGAGVLVVTHLLHDFNRVDHLLELTGAEDR